VNKNEMVEMENEEEFLSSKLKRASGLEPVCHNCCPEACDIYATCREPQRAKERSR
jgi:hypothetical protein